MSDGSGYNADDARRMSDFLWITYMYASTGTGAVLSVQTSNLELTGERGSPYKQRKHHGDFRFLHDHLGVTQCA